MKLQIDNQVESIHEISSEEFNRIEINCISYKYKEERQKSKAPTFALT